MTEDLISLFFHVLQSVTYDRMLFFYSSSGLSIFPECMIL